MVVANVSHQTYVTGSQLLLFVLIHPLLYVCMYVHVGVCVHF